MLYSDLIG